MMLVVSVFSFTVFFVFIGREILPRMMEDSERDYILGQEDSIEKLFTQEQDRIFEITKNMALQPGTLALATGINPDVRNNISGDRMTLARLYRVNYVFIKNLNNEDVYGEACDYLSNEQTSDYESNAGYLSALFGVQSEQILNQLKTRSLQTEDQNFTEDKIFHEIMLFERVPYYVCIVPIIERLKPVGTVVCATRLDDIFFKRLTLYPNTRYEFVLAPLESTPLDQLTKKDITLFRRDNDTIILSIEYKDMYRQKLLLNLIVYQPIYRQGEHNLDMFFVFVMISFIIFCWILFIVIKRSFFEPLTDLTKEVYNINVSTNIREEHYLSASVLYNLARTVNLIHERLNISLKSSESFRDYDVKTFGREFTETKNMDGM
ncbi:hypothetical protein FACS1894172_01860 [Spirochaetia bacterium]|nr:hypothetical protein FACS1894172_01860 [Spirochaetia bacterium]